MTYVEQMSDSNNLTGQTLLTSFLFPALPYHTTVRVNYFAVIAELWRVARRTAREGSTLPRWHPEPRRT